MSFIFLTRFLFMLYAIGCMAGLMTMGSNLTEDTTFKFADVGTVFLWPLLVPTKKGRERLITSLTGAKK